MHFRIQLMKIQLFYVFPHNEMLMKYIVPYKLSFNLKILYRIVIKEHIRIHKSVS